MKNIYLIDDDETSNFYNSFIIKKVRKDIELNIFTEPSEAISYLSQTTELPSIIFLDLDMPVMDGWDFIKEYKKLNISIPIIMLTSSNSKIEKDMAQNFPEILLFIVKPMEISVLTQVFQKYLD